MLSSQGRLAQAFAGLEDPSFPAWRVSLDGPNLRLSRQPLAFCFFQCGPDQQLAFHGLGDQASARLGVGSNRVYSVTQ